MSKYKTGLDYFPFDIDFFSDQKIEFLSAKYGIKGEIIAIKLLCKIYRDGYYLNWGEDECLLFSKKAGDNISVELVDDVIKELLKRNFFDEKLYKKYQILTSKGIQERYLEATKRRKEVALFKEYYLLNHINADSKPENVYIIPLDVDISKQSKVKYSKEENSKVKKKYLDVVFLTDIEYNKLTDKFGEVIANDKIEELSLYIKSQGKEKKYKDHYATILTWDRKNKKKSPEDNMQILK